MYVESIDGSNSQTNRALYHLCFDRAKHLRENECTKGMSRCNPEEDLGVRDLCAGFPLLEFSFVSSGSRPEANQMRYLLVFIMINVCGRSKAENREQSTSVLCILILLFSLSHVLCIL